VGALAADLPTPEEIAKMRVKQIKIMLKERGVLEKCRGCAEKDDFVKLLTESINLPIVETIHSGEPSPPAGEQMRSGEYEEIMKKFKDQEEQNQKMKEKYNLPEGVNFGGSGMNPEMMETVAKAMAKDKGSGGSEDLKPAPGETWQDSTIPDRETQESASHQEETLNESEEAEDDENHIEL